MRNWFQNDPDDMEVVWILILLLTIIILFAPWDR